MSWATACATPSIRDTSSHRARRRFVSDVRMTPITTPKAWRGETLARETSWIVTLTEAEIADIDRALATAKASRPAARGDPARALSADRDARQARAGGDRDVRRPRVRRAARPARPPVQRRRRRPHLLGLRPLHGRAALPEPPGRAARPRLRPRADLRQHRRARLRDQRLPAVPHRRGRHGGAALPAPLARGRAQQHRELDDGAQRDPGPAPRVPRPPLQRLLLHPPRGGPRPSAASPSARSRCSATRTAS